MVGQERDPGGVECREPAESPDEHDETKAMTTVTIEEAQAKLPELIEMLGRGEELVITRGQQPVARLMSEQPPAQKPRQPGSAKGKLVVLKKDEEHLEDFKEYMP